MVAIDARQGIVDCAVVKRMTCLILLLRSCPLMTSRVLQSIHCDPNYLIANLE